MIQDSDTSVNQVYDKYYGSDGFTISANGGQVFIEIDFKEAIDYTNSGQGGINSTEGGTLSINNSILFYPYPPPLDKIIHGISLQVRQVVSKFTGGKFTQDLDCFMNDFGQVSADANGVGEATSNSPGTGPVAGNSAVTTSNTGMKTDPNVNTTKPQAPTKNSNQAPAQPVTNTGPGGKPVAGDHGGG